MVRPSEIREVVQVNKNFPHTRSFEVDWLDHGNGAYLAHNLPKQCFKFFPNELIIHSYPTRLIMVSYKPCDGHVFNEELFIVLVDKMHRAPTVRIIVQMVDNMDPGHLDSIHGQRLPHLRQLSLDCKVCFQPYSDNKNSNIPRFLSECGHTLCHTCADTLQKMSPDKLSIDCPFDRTITKVNVEKLHKNFAIIDLIRERERRDEAKLTENMKVVGIKEDPIIPCFENPEHESTRYCQTCKVDFCDSCFLSIHSTRINSNHESIPISQKPVEIPQCPNHPEFIAQFVCQDENCKTPLCCNTCFNEHEKRHSLIAITTEMSNNQIKLFELLESLEFTEINVSGALKKADRCIKSTNKTDADYRKMVASINEHFDRKKLETIQNLESFVDNKREGMEKDKKHIEKDLGLIKDTKKEIEKVLKRKDLLFAQEFINKGEALCSLDDRKEANLVPLSLPSLEEIIDSKTGSPKPSVSSPSATAPPKISPPPIPLRTFRAESSSSPSSPK